MYFSEAFPFSLWGNKACIFTLLPVETECQCMCCIISPNNFGWVGSWVGEWVKLVEVPSRKGLPTLWLWRGCSIITPCHTGERIGSKNRQCEVWWCQREGGWAAKENLVFCGHQAGMGYDSIGKQKWLVQLFVESQDWSEPVRTYGLKGNCFKEMKYFVFLSCTERCSYFQLSCVQYSYITALRVANGSHYTTSLR